MTHTTTSPRRSWPRRLIITTIVAVGLFYGAGAWYLSELVYADGLETTPSPIDYPLAIVTSGGGEVLLSSVDSDEHFKEGRFGLDWSSGYATTTRVIARSGNTATRDYEGEDPEPGRPARIDGYAFEQDPLVGLTLPFESVQYASPLGEMDAWFVPGERSDTWMVIIHGQGATKREGLRLLAVSHDAGMPALIINYRNDQDQPADPSGIYQWGGTEWEDLAAAVDYALAEGAGRVVIGGYNMGGATAMSYLYEIKPGSEVAGLVLDSPVLNLSNTVDYGADQINLPFVGLPILDSLVGVGKWLVGVRFGVDWDALNYLARADELRTPILTLHGTGDLRVPLSQSVELRDARPDLVNLVQIEGAGHAQSWNQDPGTYSAAVLDFLDRVAPSS